jgi:hypothetical protein
MTYNFRDRLDTLGSRMKQLHSNSLTYSRSGVSVTVDNFTPEKVDVEQLQALGIAVLNEKWQSFAFDLEDLSVFSPAEPVRNDSITWDGRQYSVSPISDELFRYTTSSRKRIIVHARQIA